MNLFTVQLNILQVKSRVAFGSPCSDIRNMHALLSKPTNALLFPGMHIQHFSGKNPTEHCVKMLLL